MMRLSFICVSLSHVCFFHRCDVTHSYVWRDSFGLGNGVPNEVVPPPFNAGSRNRTHRWCISFICVINDTCLFHMCVSFIRMSVSYAWRDSFMSRSCDLATHCNTLLHTATHCNTLQHTATHCNTLIHVTFLWPGRSGHWGAEWNVSLSRCWLPK